MMTDYQNKRALAHMRLHPKAGARTLMQASGCTRHSADSFLKAYRVDGRGDVSGRPVPPGGKKSLKEFQSQFDYRARLSSLLERLCSDQFVSESEIRARSGIPAKQFSALARLPEFSRCRIRDNGVLWWSSAKNAAVVRQAARKVGVNK